MNEKFKYMSLILFLIVITSLLYFIIENKFSNEINIYVSTNGSNSNTGHKKSPLKTIEYAKEMVRKILKDENFNKKIIRINLREGTYYINNTLFFNNLDCGDNNIKIIYTSYKNENVILTSTSFFNNNNEKFIVLNNVTNLTFRYLTIQHTLGNALEINNCNNILLDNITFENLSEEL